MIPLDRNGVKPPPNWEELVARRFKGREHYERFCRAAALYEALDPEDERKRNGFSKFPDCGLPGKEKKDFPSVWSKAKAALARMSHKKCAYCEGDINAEGLGQVEHFKPKARFPTLAYRWENYFLACGGCNGAKLDHWPKKGGYLRPDEIDPRAYLAFRPDGKVEAVNEDGDALNTIADLALNREWLVDRRSLQLTVALGQVEDLASLYPLDPPMVRQRLQAALARLSDPQIMYSAALSQCFRQAWNAKFPSDQI